MSADERRAEYAGASNQWPGGFHPASVDRTQVDDRLAPHRALDERGVPEINAYAPSEVDRVIFHELDADNDPSGTAFIEADDQSVFNTEDLR